MEYDFPLRPGGVSKSSRSARLSDRRLVLVLLGFTIDLTGEVWIDL